jgi:hypothetical protein
MTGLTRTASTCAMAVNIIYVCVPSAEIGIKRCQMAKLKLRNIGISAACSTSISENTSVLKTNL